MENKWLDSLNIPNLIRQYRPLKHRKYKVDGYDPDTNTVYEFLGDYWHSNIEKSHILPNKKHPSINGITHSQNYLKTLSRLNEIKNAGYNVVYIWESNSNYSKL